MYTMKVYPPNAHLYTGISRWSSASGTPCIDFHMSFPWRNLHHPSPKAGLGVGSFGAGVGGENGFAPSSSPELKVCAPHSQRALTEKQSTTLFSWFPSSLCVRPACDPVFLSQAQDPVLSVQTLRTPVIRTQAAPPRGRREVSLLLPFAGPLLGEQSPDCATVLGLQQHWA